MHTYTAKLTDTWTPLISQLKSLFAFQMRWPNRSNTHVLITHFYLLFHELTFFSFFGVASLFELLCAKCRRHRIHHHINGSNHIRINRLLQLQQCVGWSHVYVGLLYSRSLSGGCTLEHGNYAIGTFTSQNFSGRFADLVSGTDRGTSPEATGKCSRILGL